MVLSIITSIFGVGAGTWRLLFFLAYFIREAVSDEHHGSCNKPHRDPQPPVGGRYCEAECPRNPYRSGSLDSLYVEAALENDGTAKKADPGQETLKRAADRTWIKFSKMAAQQHVGRASDGDQHHPGNAYRFVVDPPLKTNASTD